jgi:sortase A
VRPRVVAGIALVIAGSALVAWAGNAYARGWLAQERARNVWEQRVAHAEVARGRVLAAGSAPNEVVEGAPVARLMIPKIHLDDIVLEGVTPTALNGGPGHLPGSALPGAEGNAVISAHRDRHFKRLGELQIGDIIETQTLTDSVSWRIVGRRVVNRAAPVIRKELGEVLTLTTCWPIGYLGGAPDRLILRAVPTRDHTVQIATIAGQPAR